MHGVTYGRMPAIPRAPDGYFVPPLLYSPYFKAVASGRAALRIVRFYRVASKEITGRTLGVELCTNGHEGETYGYERNGRDRLWPLFPCLTFARMATKGRQMVTAIPAVFLVVGVSKVAPVPGEDGGQQRPHG